MASFYGSPCKGTCSGHQAGWSYAQHGGSRPSPHSSSFNNGLALGKAMTQAMNTPTPKTKTHVAKKHGHK